MNRAKALPIDPAKLNAITAEDGAKILRVAVGGTRVTLQWPDKSIASLYYSYGDWHFSDSGSSPGYDHACGGLSQLTQLSPVERQTLHNHLTMKTNTLPATSTAIQHHTFPDGGFVLHKIQFVSENGWFSAWFSATGALLDAERIWLGHPDRQVTRDGPVWRMIRTVGQRYVGAAAPVAVSAY